MANEQRVFTVDSKLDPLGYQQITALSSAVGLSPPTKARIALIQASTQGVRWRDDGTAPTGTIGMPLGAGNDFVYTGNLAAIQFIEVAPSAQLNVSYYY